MTLPQTKANLDRRCATCGRMMPRAREHLCGSNTAHLQAPEVMARSAATRAQVVVPAYYFKDRGCVVVGPRCSGCPHPDCISPEKFFPHWQGEEARDAYLERFPRYLKYAGG